MFNRIIKTFNQYIQKNFYKFKENSSKVSSTFEVKLTKDYLILFLIILYISSCKSSLFLISSPLVLIGFFFLHR